MLPRQEYLFYIFVGCFLLIWNPSKSVAYIVPYLAIFLTLAIPTVRTDIAKRSAILLLLILIHSISANLVYGNFAWQNLAIFLITNSALIFLICVPNNAFWGSNLRSRITYFLAIALTIEASIGIVQGMLSYLIHGTIDSDSGDLVTGSFAVFSINLSERGFSNPIFAANVCCCCIYLSSQKFNSTLKYLAITTALGSLLLASVMHINLFLLTSLLVATVLSRDTLFSWRSLRTILLSAITAAIVSAIIWTIVPNNVASLFSFADQARNVDLPKAIAHYHQFSTIPSEQPVQSLLGFGAGQYNSKAALIGTEMYFGSPKSPKNLPLISPITTEHTERYLLDLWIMAVTTTYGGSTVAPWSSWLASWGEFGAIPFALLVAFLIFRFRKLARDNHTPNQ